MQTGKRPRSRKVKRYGDWGPFRYIQVAYRPPKVVQRGEIVLYIFYDAKRCP